MTTKSEILFIVIEALKSNNVPLDVLLRKLDLIVMLEHAAWKALTDEEKEEQEQCTTL